MERAAKNPFSKDANLLLVNLAGVEDAKMFTRARGISTVTSLSGRPSGEYAIKYIPHKVLIDGKGIVVQNFKVDWETVDSLLR